MVAASRAFAVCAVVALALVAGAAARRPRWNELKGYTFEQYCVDFKKPYGHVEHPAHAMRRANFNENLAYIQELNADMSRSWRAGVNMFTDMSRDEFKAYNRFKKAPENAYGPPTVVHGAPSADEVMPKTVDWRTAVSPRVLTAVKHQGACGSCWAHSAAESMESQYALLTGMLPVLSVAQINSCTPASYGGTGCDGGEYGGAWAYLANTSVSRPTVLQSVTENWPYPIPPSDWFFDDQPKGYKTSACKDITKDWTTPTTSWFAELTAVGVSGFGSIDSNSPSGGPAAQKALRDIGPQSISVAAGNWQWYESGIFTNTNSSGGANEWAVDHAVQMVGYGYDKEMNMNYWIVRNSWSTLWGEDGFIRLFRANDGEPEPCSGPEYGNVCGTSGCLNQLQYPIVYEATPTKFG